MGDIRGFSEIYEDIQVSAGVQVVMRLLRSDSDLSTKALAVFRVAKIDTAENTILRNFIVTGVL